MDNMSIIQHPSIERKIKVASKSSPKDEIQTPNNINFIQVFLNYGYYFLLTPFKINKHPVSAEYELGSNWTQKVNYSCTITSLTNYINSSFSDSTSDPVCFGPFATLTTISL